MQGKLETLVLNIQEVAKSADVSIDELKQLLLLFYPFEEEVQKADNNLSHIFVVVRKLCSPVNTDILMLIINHFKLFDALIAIQAYEAEEQNYRKKLASTTFAKEVQKEAELLGRNPTAEDTIALKLKWSSSKPSTVKEFERVVRHLFLDYSQYIHLYEVGYEEGTDCISVTMCAPKPLLRALVKMTKTRLPYFINSGVILLQIGDEVFLDKRREQVNYYE